MKLRTTIAGLIAAGALLPAAPADAMLPATEGGWTPKPLRDCNWDCIARTWPKLYANVEDGQQRMARKGIEPNAKLLELSRQSQEMSLYMNSASTAIKAIGEASQALSRKQ